MRLKHFDLVVVAAIVVSSPMAPGIIDGAISATTAVTRFLIALVVCAAGGEVLQRVVSGYADQARRTQILRQLAEARQLAEGNQAGGAPAGRPMSAEPDDTAPPRGFPPQPTGGPTPPGGARP